MNDHTPDHTPDDELLSRYISTEWVVSEASAVALTKLAKALDRSLRELTTRISRAHAESDWYTLSADVSKLFQVLEAIEPMLEEIMTGAIAHYVELLGTRGQLSDMFEAMSEYFDATREDAQRATIPIVPGGEAA